LAYVNPGLQGHTRANMTLMRQLRFLLAHLLPSRSDAAPCVLPESARAQYAPSRARKPGFQAEEEEVEGEVPVADTVFFVLLLKRREDHTARQSVLWTYLPCISLLRAPLRCWLVLPLEPTYET
jgi:hypothetical protein